MKKYRYILFDLDGTLLPMNQDNFIKKYLPAVFQRRCIGCMSIRVSIREK